MGKAVQGARVLRCPQGLLDLLRVYVAQCLDVGQNVLVQLDVLGERGVLPCGAVQRTANAPLR